MKSLLRSVGRPLSAALVCVASLHGQGGDDPLSLPLLAIDELQYAGGFRLPARDFGASSLNFSQGPIEYNAEDHTLFIVGHTYQQAIAEFAVPTLVNDTVLEELAMAGDPVQVFSSVLDDVSGGNEQGLNRIGGMELVQGPDGPELLVNAFEYYDASGSNTVTTLVIRDAGDLAGSAIDGYFAFAGGAGHTSGWMSPIPAGWQSLLGGTHITGQSSGIPIISRCTVGPSAFAFDPLDIAGVPSPPTPVPTVRLLDFSLAEPLHEDLSNGEGDNDLWTHLSRAVYGLVVPGTRTYFTIGQSGGHESGVCYKCTQDEGHLCGGYCTPKASDNYQYYWLWDLRDLLAVKNGEMLSHEVRPYDYGRFSTPFQHRFNEIGGGSFDPASGLLYLSVQRADRAQGTYANPPVIVAYRFDTATRAKRRGGSHGTAAVRGAVRVSVSPAAGGGSLRVALDGARFQEVSVAVHDLAGRLRGVRRHAVGGGGERTITVPFARAAAGMLIVSVSADDFSVSRAVSTAGW